MRSSILVTIWGLYSFTCLAQKPAIDLNTLKNWTSAGFPVISNNGSYVLYTIENQPIGSRTLVVLNTKSNWRFEVQASYGLFTSDSKYVFFKKAKDSLGFIKTGKDLIHYISCVKSFSVSRNGNGKWIVYQLNNSQNTLVVYNLEDSHEKTFDSVKQYMLSEDGSTLLLLTEEKKDTTTQVLYLMNLASGIKKNIWQGGNAGNFVFNKNSQQIAFVVERFNNKSEKSFWYYRTGMDKAIELATNRSIENDSTIQLESIGYFSKNDSCLLVTLKQKASPKPSPSPLDVWSFTDVKLQSKQLNELSPRRYKASINIQNSHLLRLENENEMLYSVSLQNSKSNKWGLIVRRPGEAGEEGWNVNASISVELISMIDGVRKKIPGLTDISAEISPEGRYVIYYDPSQKSYFSYEIKSGITRNITKDIPVVWIGYSKDRPISGNFPRGIAGWLKNDEAVLVYDENDIWQIDMAGEKKSINITEGYGKKNNIVFSLDLVDYNLKTFSYNERLILNAFNSQSKDNGYFAKTLSQTGDPELLSMGPYIYNIPNNPYIPDGSNFAPVKALQADVYLVRRMSAKEAPNNFITTDFKTFTPLSDVHPERNFNWLRADLITWKALDGRSIQGILYRPENFDAQKKYPIIFNYYERKSDGLNAFLQPDILYSGGNINIPWYTSNGYIVCLPDIHYKIGETGESVINSVVSAAQYLSKMPWINPQKMGIQGFSFGGYETNFLVTQSSLFAAACSASGISNLISAYGGLSEDGVSLQSLVEFLNFRMGATLWQRPDLYIKNSPIFAADKVTTPLLIMHTKQDGICPFANAIELFTALRRLNKKVWMLQYEGNHGLDGESAADFSIRMQQFFDHYLKDAPAPKWMSKGIPAKLKGIESGLDITQN